MAGLLALVPVFGTAAKGAFIAVLIPLVIWAAFSDTERARIPDDVHRLAHIAGQLAAKEAVTKALGTGFGDDVAFGDVEIGRTEAGPRRSLCLKGAGFTFPT